MISTNFSVLQDLIALKIQLRSGLVGRENVVLNIFTAAGSWDIWKLRNDGETPACYGVDLWEY
jgi:hypothetical protein